MDDPPAGPTAPPDLAELVARFGARLAEAGVPVPPERTARFAHAITLVRPGTTRALYWCALATLVGDPAQVPVLDRVFGEVFVGLVDPADSRGDPNAPPLTGTTHVGPASRTAPPFGVPQAGPAGTGTGTDRTESGRREAPLRAWSSAEERLATRDFAELSPDELLALVDLMRREVLATPPKRSRRHRSAGHGHRVDLRGTLREARRTGGDPVRLLRRVPRTRPRRLVVLCDISGSMEPYARALLQLLCCAAGGAGSRQPKAEVFTFATRLTRLTGVLSGARPALALERAGRAAPDWSGGTRIGAAVKRFNDGYGCGGLARGAVVLIISDGWETGDPALLGTQLARLSRVAYRIVWANPRTQDPRYRPAVGGMAAAWPYCDAVVSAHRLDALGELSAALADPVRRRPRRFGEDP
ncbi:MAG TPA: VWA domain-containing protein [Mycobacteriales bacterium]|nr:VWA domain-containing protein [Mycobacteriales bacterium]